MSEPIYITEDHKVSKVIQVEGQGEQAKEGDKVKVHYTGTLTNGEKFDSSRDRNDPFEFTIGQGVITGWSLGVATMKVGERSVFTIESDYGYGDAGSPPKIPGGATLIFDIELLSIKVSFKNKEDALAAANQHCDDATVSFRAKDFKKAIEIYHKALDCCKDFYGKEIDSMKIRLNRNLAVAHSRLQQWHEVLIHANDVLTKEENDAKSLIRVVEAQIALGNLDEARKALTKGLKVTNNDPAFVAFRGKLDQAEKEERIRQNSLFKRMVAEEKKLAEEDKSKRAEEEAKAAAEKPAEEKPAEETPAEEAPKSE